MKVGFLTLGCRVNQYETEKIVNQFENKGYDLCIDTDAGADIYIINTCSVTAIAEKKSRQFIRRVKRNNPDAVIVAVGCYVQKEDLEFLSMSEIDLFVGNNKKNEVISDVEEFLRTRNVKKDIIKRSEMLEFEEMEGFLKNSRIRPYIKIQEGCDRFCSFCIIPHLRGKVRSRDKNNILEEVEYHLKNGVKEIVLTGINTALYGKDFEDYTLYKTMSSFSSLDTKWK